MPRARAGGPKQADAGLGARRSSRPASAPGRTSTYQAGRLPGQCACGGGCPLCGIAAPPRAESLIRAALRSPDRPLDGTTAAAMTRAFAVSDADVPPPDRATSPAIPQGALRLGADADREERAASRTARRVGERVGAVDAGGYARDAAAGPDFGHVRVHTGAAAALAAYTLRTPAFTLGDHVVFGAGRYAPADRAGRGVLAHELTHVLQNRAAGDARVVRGYEGFEHRSIGDDRLRDLYVFIGTPAGRTWAAAAHLDVDALTTALGEDRYRRGAKIRVNAGLELTPGEAIALMGDFHATPDALANADSKETAQLLAVMDDEQLAGASSAESNVRYEKITKGRYSELARNNAVHFSPRNRQEWGRMHQEALGLAHESARTGNARTFERALLVDAAGGHFLTDAFAAGHMFDLPRVMLEISLRLPTAPLDAWPEMSTPVNLLGVAGVTPLLVLKNIHDRFNVEGFEVTNRLGMRWRTYGDNTLKKSEETPRIAALAVFLSRGQLQRARAGETLDPREVSDLLPDDASQVRATQLALSYVPAAIRDMAPLMYRQQAMFSTVPVPWYYGGPVGPWIGQRIIQTTGSPGRPRQLEDLQRFSAATGQGPILAPQLTLKGF